MVVFKPSLLNRQISSSNYLWSIVLFCVFPFILVSPRLMPPIRRERSNLGWRSLNSTNFPTAPHATYSSPSRHGVTDLQLPLPSEPTPVHIQDIIPIRGSAAQDVAVSLEVTHPDLGASCQLGKLTGLMTPVKLNFLIAFDSTEVVNTPGGPATLGLGWHIRSYLPIKQKFCRTVPSLHDVLLCASIPSYGSSCFFFTICFARRTALSAWPLDSWNFGLKVTGTKLYDCEC